MRQAVSALTRGRLGSVGSGGPTPSTQERCATAVRESREEPVLLAINAERRRDGAEPIPKLTVCFLWVSVFDCRDHALCLTFQGFLLVLPTMHLWVPSCHALNTDPTPQ